MSEIRIKGLNKVIKQYQKMEKKFPTLRRNTLNDMARDAQKNAKKFVGKEFINRNKFTLRSIIFRKATNSPSSSSAVGSLQKYMADQEFGNASLKVGHIPTQKARVTKSRRRVVRGPNKINRLGGATRRASGIVAVRQQIRNARIRNDKSVMKLNFMGKKGRVKGLFRLEGSKKRTITMIQDLRKSHVTIKKKQWLEPSTRKTLKKGQKIFKKNLKFFV